jgi:RNA methyltransferase, TrmH family
MKTIKSRQNPHITAIIALKKTQGRHAQEKLLVEGLRAISTVIEAGWEPLDLLVTQDMVQQALSLAPDDIITLVDQPVMEKISQSTTPSGMVGIFKLPKKPKTEKLNAGLVLVDIMDPGNMGTLIRTCAAMGFQSVVIVEGADPWSHKVIQASAGTIAYVNIFCWSWEKLLQNKGANTLVALVAHKGAAPEELDPVASNLLVVGNEAHGLSDAIVKLCDKKVTLPMPGRTESLNAAVAGSIALYLVRTHRQTTA